MTEKAPRPKNNPESIEKLEEQFDNPKTVEVYDGKLQIYSVEPENPKTEVPTIVAPGWAANAKVFKDNVMELAQRDRKAISLGNYHGVKNQLERPDDIPNAEWRKVVALIGLIEQNNLEKVDVIAHSEGAINTLLAAKMYPDKFRNIVLVNPAGFIEEDSATKLTARFGIDILRQQLRGALGGRGYKAALRRVGAARNEALDKGEQPKIPKFSQYVKHLGPEKVAGKSAGAVAHLGKASLRLVKTVQEVFAISSSDMIDTLDELSGQGVNVGILHAASDKAFPIKRVKEVTGDKVKQFKTRPGGHNEAYLNAGKFTRAAERMLTSMEEENNVKKV